MTRTTPKWIAFGAISVLVFACSASADDPTWKQHTINAQSEFEAAGVVDVDNDGKLDIVSGDSWYQAPDWKPYHVRDVTRVGSYFNCFATLPLDVNADGHVDYITCSYFGKNVGWVENPGKFGIPGRTTNSTPPETSRRRGWSISQVMERPISCPTPSTSSSGMKWLLRVTARVLSSRSTISVRRPPGTGLARATSTAMAALIY